jgi:hypothetical protein
MANDLYYPYKQVLLGAATYTPPVWSTDTIAGALVTATYTPSITTDTYYSTIPGGAIASSVTIPSITTSAGKVIQTALVTFPSVAAGAACLYLILYKNTGSPSTSPLLVFFDTFTAGMPVTPNGRDIEVAFDIAGIWGL